MGHHELRRRRHAGPEQQFRVVRRQHGLVRHDALNDFRSVAEFADFRIELFAGIGIDAEVGFLTFTDLADIGFVHIHLNLHLPEIFGDRKQNGRLQRRGHRLTRLDIAAQDDAGDGRADERLLEIGFAESKIGAGCGHIRLGAFGGGQGPLERGVGGLELLDRTGLARGQLLFAIIFEAGLLDAGLGLANLGFRGLELGARTVDRRSELLRVELRQRLSRGYGTVVVHEDPADDARQFARDLDFVGRLHRAGCGHSHRQIAFRRRLGDVAHAVCGISATEQRIEEQCGTGCKP